MTHLFTVKFEAVVADSDIHDDDLIIPLFVEWGVQHSSLVKILIYSTNDLRGESKVEGWSPKVYLKIFTQRFTITRPMNCGGKGRSTVGLLKFTFS